MRIGYRYVLLACVLLSFSAQCAALSWEGEYTQSSVTVKWARASSCGYYMHVESTADRCLWVTFTSGMSALDSTPQLSTDGQLSTDDDWQLGVVPPGVSDFWYSGSMVIPTTIKSFRAADPDADGWKNAIEGYHSHYATLQYGRLSGDTFIHDEVGFRTRVESCLAQMPSESEASVARQGQQKAIDYVDLVLEKDTSLTADAIKGWTAQRERLRAIKIAVRSGKGGGTPVKPPVAKPQPAAPTASVAPTPPPTPPAAPQAEPFKQLPPVDLEQVKNDVARDFEGDVQQIVQQMIGTSETGTEDGSDISNAIQSTLAPAASEPDGELPRDSDFAGAWDKIPRYIEYRKDGTYDENGKPLPKQPGVSEVNYYPSSAQYTKAAAEEAPSQSDFDSAFDNVNDPYAAGAVPQGPTYPAGQAQPTVAGSPNSLWDQVSDYPTTGSASSLMSGLRDYYESAKSSLFNQFFPHPPPNETAEDAFESLMQHAQPWKTIGGQIFNNRTVEKGDALFSIGLSEIYPGLKE